MASGELLKEFYLLRSAVGDDLTEPSVLRTIIEAVAEQRGYAPGEVIFRQGERADAMYVVATGGVEILAADPSRPGTGEQVVSVLSTGDEFGEMAFFDAGDRSATARAGANCNVLRVPYDALRAQLKTRPEASALLYRNAAAFMAKRLRLTTLDLSASREENRRHL